MSFQAPTALAHNVASTISELWPSMRSSLSVPSKRLRHLKWNGGEVPLDGSTKSMDSEARPTMEIEQIPCPGPALPDFLALVSMDTLRSSPCVVTLSSVPSPYSPSCSTFRMSYSVPCLNGSGQAKSLWSANLISRGPTASLRTTRPYSTLPPFRLFRPCTPVISQMSKNLQRRRIFGGGSSQNLLAHMEQTANNNPTSATAQNAFYSALLRANMPAIVVERYQTGRYASNPACETTYLRALEKLGQSEGSSAFASTGQQSSSISNEQLQALGQAVAAQSRGGNIGMVRGKSGPTGTGAKESPLYVVVEESLGGTVFKWTKFLLIFGLVCYALLVFMTIIVETTGVIKKVGGMQNNEAQPQHQTVRFSDVHGCDEAKEELQELVEFLKNPEKFSALGGKLPKGVLLVGPPGTGKTLLARAVAGEAGVPFFFMSGSEFDEVYVGVGAKRVRDLFNSARGKAPAIIFIDELDAIGGKRNERDAAYVKQTLNQLLTELDGFSQGSGVIILAATNFPQLLDKALTRPGRFDRNVTVPLPDVRGRMEILRHHMKNVQIGTDVDEKALARGTPGFSGADIENLVNQAAVRASRNSAKKVSMLDFEWAKDKIMMGAERRSAIIQDKDKLMTAYHEGGHALVALHTPGHDPLYKITIMPRGPALGITHFLPEMDQVSVSKKQYLARIASLMGGKVAEELVYGQEEVSSGASADIQGATQVATAMVTQMGMSDSLGNVDLWSNYREISPETKQKIEHEVRRLVEEGKDRARKILTERRKDLDIVAKALIEYEVLTLDELEKVLKGEKLQKLSAVPNGGTGGSIKIPEIVLPPGLGGIPPATTTNRKSTNDGDRPEPNSDSGARL